MAAKNQFGLGRGLEALLPRNDDEENDLLDSSAGSISAADIPIEKILANPNQPRKFFDEDSLAELAASIKQNGVIEPIIVSKDGDVYTIVAGERRYRAAKIAGLTTIPAIVRDYTANERIAIALIENIQRADLNPIEEACAYKALMDEAGLTQDEAALRVGKNRSTLANSLRLLKLPVNMQDALKSGAISPGHARAILSIENTVDQQTLFNEISNLSLSVRQAEKKAAEFLLTSHNGGNSNDKNATNISVKKSDPELLAIQQKFIETFGTKVIIDGSLEKGTVRIEYYNMEGLERIHDVIIGTNNS